MHESFTLIREGLALRCSELCAVGTQALLDPAGKRLEQRTRREELLS